MMIHDDDTLKTQLLGVGRGLKLKRTSKMMMLMSDLETAIFLILIPKYSLDRQSL